MNIIDLQHKYNEIGFTLIEMDGVYYVQKQETAGSSETITLPELRNKRWDNCCSTQ